MRNPVLRRAVVSMAVLTTLVASACGSGDADSAAGPREITLVTHDSFALTEEVLESFTDQTGVRVNVVGQGDAGSALAKVMLTKDNPVGDVFFGVDNTLMTRALESGAFLPYESPALSRIADEYELDPSHRLTPVDHGEVCIDYDKNWFASRGLALPQTLDDLIRPEYRNLLVVANPATSSPGLAFLLATIARFGESDNGGWKQYWRDLQDNNVAVVAGWDQAYNTEFSAGPGSGDRPLVLSYASSPPADIAFAPDPKPAEPNIGVLTNTCFRQVEFAGVLSGSQNVTEAQRFIDFLLSDAVQADVPLQMFVYPVVEDVALPELFTRFAAPVEDPLDMDAARIADNRDRWIREWSELHPG